MNLARLASAGHYHVPTGPGRRGACQAALVTHVWDDVIGNDQDVNVVAWTSDGSDEPHTRVQVTQPVLERASFHLVVDCPFGR